MKAKVALIALYDLNSFSIRILHSVLQKDGFPVTSIFFNRENINNTMDYATDEEITALVKLLKTLEPQIIGISIRTTLFKLACKITNAIKKELNSLVVWGGVHPTIRPEQCLQFADVVCIGEGEKPLVELATKISNNESIAGINNLWVKVNGEIVKNEMNPLISDLDSVPFPDYMNENKIFFEKGSAVNFPNSSTITTFGIMTARGCPYRCTYCCNNVFAGIYSNKGRYLRRRSVQNVISELSNAKKMFSNLKFIYFFDDVFTFDKEWVKQFSVEYKKQINLPFWCYVHPRMVDEDVIKMLRDSGLDSTTMGIQSGSEKVRHDLYDRYDPNKVIVQSAHVLHKLGIKCSYDIILDCPFETEEDKRETLELLLQLPRPFELHTHSMTWFPETKLTKLALEKKLISPNDVEDNNEQSYTRWTPTLDLNRNQGEVFWDSMYYLSKKSYIPKKLVLSLSKSTFLKKHSKIFTRILRLFSSDVYAIEWKSRASRYKFYLSYAIRMVLSGKFNYLLSKAREVLS